MSSGKNWTTIKNWNCAKEILNSSFWEISFFAYDGNIYIRNGISVSEQVGGIFGNTSYNKLMQSLSSIDIDDVFIVFDSDELTNEKNITSKLNGNFKIYVNKNCILGFSDKEIRIRTTFADDSYFKISKPSAYEKIKNWYETRR